MSNKEKTNKPIITINPSKHRQPTEGGNLGQIPVTKNPPPPKPKK